MLNSNHVINIRLTDFMLDMCKHFALELYHYEMPSLIFDDKLERANRKMHDSLTGMLGEGAVAFHLGKWNEWCECRTHAVVSKNPQLPFDIPGTIIDVKSRRMVDEQPDPLKYRLYVRAASTHKQATYVQVVVNASEHHAMCHIVGWIGTDELVVENALDVRGEKYQVSGCDLHPFPVVHGQVPGGEK